MVRRDTRREKGREGLKGQKDEGRKGRAVKYAAIKTALKSDAAKYAALTIALEPIKYAALTIAREPIKYAALSIDLRLKIEYNTKSNVL